MMSHEGACIAVVEDDRVMGESLQQRLNLEGFDALLWRTGADALAGLGERLPDLVVCDIRLPDINGEDLFHELVIRLQGRPVLFITAYAEIDQAVRLMRAGAADYLTKPFEMPDFLARVSHLAGRRRQPSHALGSSAAMREVGDLIERVADIDSPVLITGESGVGKEVVAKHLHAVSGQDHGPFMAVNCAAIPGELMESELFGHEKGAFTGAHARHEGYAERAGAGTLFLDEVGELPLALQGKLLRLLQDRTFHRVGGERTLPFQARVVCASNVDLDARVSSGAFREDLYYRINVIPVHVPPLRQRLDDVVPLMQHFVGVCAKAFDRPVTGASSLAEEAALAHGWPGNVRELRNRCERAVALTRDHQVGPGDLFPETASADQGTGSIAPLSDARDAAERRQIERALRHTEGHVTRTAELLGVARTTLWEKMRRHGLSTERAAFESSDKP